MTKHSLASTLSLYLFQGRSLVSILMAQVRRYNIVVPLSPLETLSEKGKAKNFSWIPIDGSKRIIDLWLNVYRGKERKHLRKDEMDRESQAMRSFWINSWEEEKRVKEK